MTESNCVFRKIGEDRGTEPRAVFLYKAAVLRRVNAEAAQRKQHLCRRFGASRAPRLIAAVCLLQAAQHRQAAIDRFLDLCLLVVRCERLNDHRGHIDIRLAAEKCPAAVCQLLVQKLLHIALTRRRRALGKLIRGAVQSEQGIKRSVDALRRGLVKIAQRRDHAVARKIGRVHAAGRQRKRDAGISGVVELVHHALFLSDLLRHIRQIFRAQLLRQVAAAGKLQNRPVAEASRSACLDKVIRDAVHRVGKLHRKRSRLCRKRSGQHAEQKRQRQKKCNRSFHVGSSNDQN